MSKILIILLIVCHFLIISKECYSIQKETEMKVIKTKGTYLVANKGSSQDVTINSIYDIISVTSKERKIIGQAKVVLVRNNISGLKILNLATGYIIKPGYILIQNIKKYSEEDNIFNEMESIDLKKQKEKQKIDQFYQQQYYRNSMLNKYITKISIGRWGLFFSWLLTAAGSSAMGDEMFETTVIPVVGPFVTMHRIESANLGYLSGGKELLIISGTVQSFFATYYVYYLIKDSKHRRKQGFSLQPNINNIGFKLTYNF